jgi:hypothetical protein
MNEMSAAIERLRFAVRTLPGVLAGFSEAESDQRPSQSARWSDLIDLWRAYNTHLLHVIGCMTEEGRRATCRVGGGPEVTLAGLFVDYVDHLEHHLRKMLGRWESGAA